MILYLAELSKKTDQNPIGSTPSNDIDRIYNVYEFYIGKAPENSYWIDWGGSYNNPGFNNIELFFERYLTRVNSIEEVKKNEFTYIIIEDFIYFNLPKHPWLYEEFQISMRENIGFLSGPKNPLDPSDDILNGSPYPARLNIPSCNSKLSQPISGVTMFQAFDFSIINNDGVFDLVADSNFFNAPSRIKKCTIENPEYSDFKTIRYGHVEDIKSNRTSIQISSADLFRTFDEEVCQKIIDKDLPVIYGRAKVDLIEIEKGKYRAAEFISSVHYVYDSDNKTTDFIYKDGIIESEKGKYADISGYTNNKIGEIIIDLCKRTPVFYTDTNYDIGEIERYIGNSPRVNFLVKGGSVKSAITEVLKSDMAFLVQKNDGRFTIRKWGDRYEVFDIDNELITQHPSKNFSEAQRNYFSAATISYDFDYKNNTYKRLFYEENEERSIYFYNKNLLKNFDTKLIEVDDAKNLAEELSSRFSFLNETVSVSVGTDTSDFNLLDIVILKLQVNDRLYSEKETWIIKEIDPAQDRLVLESFEPDFILYDNLVIKFKDEKNLKTTIVNKDKEEREIIIQGAKNA